MDREVLRDREGMITYRLGDHVVKESRDVDNEIALSNAYRFYKALEGTPYIPKLVSYTPDKLVCEYIEETPVDDTEAARRNTAHLLMTLRRFHIIHGDLTAPNFTFRDNIPVVYDWDQSIFTHEPKPQKRPKPDAYHIWPAVVDKAGDPSRVVRRWLGCLPHINYYLGWGTLCDLGTHQGDFVGLAAAQGLSSWGVDGEFIRPCINFAKELWDTSPYNRTWFIKEDIVDYIEKVDRDKFNIIMLFSVWPYIVEQRGMEVARNVLAQCINKSEIFLFETQYYGDGPGPEFIKTDGDLYSVIESVGIPVSVSSIVSIPVEGRDAIRTIWKIESK